jgi:hypothetical protein
VAWHDLLAEEDDKTVALMKNIAKARVGLITLNDEVACEVRQLQNRCCSDGTLQGLKCVLRLCTPAEAILAKKGSEWCGDSTIVSDEPVIVAGEAQEGVYRAHRSGHWPLHH